MRTRSHSRSDGAPPSTKTRKTTTTTNGFRVPYEIRESPIAGRGVFALQNIPRGALVWEYVVGQSVLEHDEASLRKRLRPMTAQHRIDLLEHVYEWEGKAIEILDDAKVWNHAANPNTGNHPDGDGPGAGDGVSSYALRDIAAGEELTDDYALHDDCPWFEEVCAEHDAISCTSLGKEHR